MNEMPNFQPQAPMFEETSTEAPKRNRRKPRAEAAEPKSPKKPGPKPTKGRAVKAVSKGKLEVSDIVNATIGLKAEEASALLTIHAHVMALPKKSRGKVMWALGRLHA